MTISGRTRLLALALAATPAWAQRAYFTDVPRTHWAFEAVQTATDEGFVSSCFTSKFHGEKLLNRFQVAHIVKRLLAAAAPRPGAEDLAQLRDLLAELRDETRQVRRRLVSVESALDTLRTRVRRRREMSSWLGGPLAPSRKDT